MDILSDGLDWIDWSIFLGAFLAFIVGLGVQLCVILWQRDQRRSAYRTLVATELMHNLTAMSEILGSIARTEANSFVAVETTIDKPRASTLRSITSSSEALLSLPSAEQVSLVQLVGQIDRLIYEYESWPSSVRPPAGVLELVSPDGRKRPARDVATEQLKATTRFLMRTQMGVLVTTLNNLPTRALKIDALRKLRDQLAPTRTRWRTSKVVQVAFETPDPSWSRDLEMKRPLVVWINERQDFPMPVIEMSKLVAAAFDDS